MSGTKDPAEEAHADELRHALRRLGDDLRVDPHAPERVTAFVDFAELAVRQLVSDADLVADLLARLRRPGDGDATRLARARRTLGRVMAWERTTGSGFEPLAGEDFERMLAGKELDFETRMRVVYELTLGVGRSWPGLDAWSPRGVGDVSDHPVVRALHTLAGGDWRHRRASLRRAADRARLDPLGFARLVVEESREVEHGPSRADELLDDPFLRRASERHWIDLRTRCALYGVARDLLRGPSGEAAERLDELTRRLDQGTGDRDLRALATEVRAATLRADGDFQSAAETYRLASDLLADEVPVDRRVEVLLERALVLLDAAARIFSDDPGAAEEIGGEAVGALESCVAQLGSLPDDVHPALRLRVVHALAQAELDMARRTITADDPIAMLSAEIGTTEAEALSAAARRIRSAYAGQADRRARARHWLRVAEPFYPLVGDPTTERLGDAARRWLLGRSWMADEPELAAEHLQAAFAASVAAGDAERAAAQFVDLATCLVLSVPAGAPVGWPVELRARLAAQAGLMDELFAGVRDGGEAWRRLERLMTALGRSSVRNGVERRGGDDEGGTVG